MLDLRRIEEAFPMIYVTLTSILLGLAIEDLISRVREAPAWDLLVLAVTANGVVLSVAVWTGYAFVAITQTRRPHILDSLNVFGLAIGVFILNSSIGQSPAFFLGAVALYNLISIYAVHYNVALFERALPFELTRSDTRGVLLGLYFSVVACSGLAALSLLDRLPEAVERVALFLPVLVNGHWALAFYRFWSTQLERAGS